MVEFRTELSDSLEEVAHIFFVDTMTNAGNIFQALAADSLVITYSSGETRKLENMFSFETVGTRSAKKIVNCAAHVIQLSFVLRTSFIVINDARRSDAR